MRARSRGNTLVIVFLALSLLMSACGATPTATPAPLPTAVPTAKPTTAPAAKPATLRLATTTSTADTGLLDAILPIFEKANNCKVDVVAVGTGQAIEIGRKGDADVLLVHAACQRRSVCLGRLCPPALRCHVSTTSSSSAPRQTRPAQRAWPRPRKPSRRSWTSKRSSSAAATSRARTPKN